MKNSKNIGTIRTGLPAAWATFLTWAIAKFGIHLEEEDYSMLLIVIPVIIPIFYRLSREIEQKWPKIGHIIFGSVAVPSYDLNEVATPGLDEEDYEQLTLPFGE